MCAALVGVAQSIGRVEPRSGVSMGGEHATDIHDLVVGDVERTRDVGSRSRATTAARAVDGAPNITLCEVAHHAQRAVIRRQASESPQRIGQVVVVGGRLGTGMRDKQVPKPLAVHDGGDSVARCLSTCPDR